MTREFPNISSAETQSPKILLRDTGVERIVGVKDETESLEAMETHLMAVALAHERELLDEREKTPEEIAMISFAEKSVNALRQRNGLPPRALPPKRVKILNTHHIVLDDAFHEGKLETTLVAGNVPLSQIELVTESAGKGLERFSAIQHEFVHAGSYQALQLDSNGKLVHYRSGLDIQSRQPNDSGKYTSFLAPLNEAIVEENARRILASIPENDSEVGHLAQKRAEDYRALLALHQQYPESVPDPTFLKNTLLSVEIRDGNLSIKYSNRYPEERRTMWSLFDTICERNPRAFPGKSSGEAREELFQISTKATLDGNILPLGRIINDTFGKGTFRKLGHLQSAEEVESYLGLLAL